MNENSLTLYFGLQKQTKVTSIGSEENTIFFILQQVFERCFQLLWITLSERDDT